MSEMDALLDEIEAKLVETARRCLRLTQTRNLSTDHNRRLVKWMFGCMNQRFTIRERVKKRGIGELSKVLLFVAKACELLMEIEPPFEGEAEEP
jgi:hypothetical protein